jgi:hypothetical protein
MGRFGFPPQVSKISCDTISISYDINLANNDHEVYFMLVVEYFLI